MQKSNDFKESLSNLSLEELKELERLLEIQFTRARNTTTSSNELLENLEEQLLAVKNRITALKIRS